MEWLLAVIAEQWGEVTPDGLLASEAAVFLCLRVLGWRCRVGVGGGV